MGKGFIDKQLLVHMYLGGSKQDWLRWIYVGGWEGQGKALGGKRQEGSYQQVGPALPASQSNQQHLLDQRQLPLACGFFLSGFTLCRGLSK